MKHLIAELLLKLAEKEEESKQLAALVNALEIVVTGVVGNMETHQREAIVANIKQAMQKNALDAHHPDKRLVETYIEKLLGSPLY
ncbi:hypothetical protein PMPD1_1149 [Paramixta manurensis]|uniref:Anti-adapter protein IraP n=1 Tax=Paramixta manurensis TaxID=2740817 RepID=A0A6M8U9B3_9GAMM|nr:hypothetical protein PMPD1_1149 [Erwiniaceae bacterium PD-1]